MIGQTLSHYRIVSKVGTGGMGEVYRALDDRLNRNVAIKVLPVEFARDPDRLRRFEQEACATSALNHPNILTIYDIGMHEGAPFIATELLEGEELRAQLQDGPLSVPQALDYAQQITSGLASAHEKGITHRDLKPENLFVTKDGRVKILDFGLAKLKPQKLAEKVDTAAPTNVPHTEPGLLMGTVGYMSPEQVRGGDIDHRSDLFSFGLILYEMLRGERAFHGETMAETMTAILRDEVPDLTESDTKISPQLERIVRRCLEKKPERRFQSTSDLCFALAALSGPSGSRMETPVASPAVATHSYRALLRVGGLALAALAAGAILGWMLKPGPTAPAVIRVSQMLPIEHVLSGPLRNQLRLSPDGTQLVYAANERLYLRAMNGLAAVELPGTEGAMGPFFSPDGQWIGFMVGPSQLKKMPVTGGTPISICATDVTGADWGPDDTILIGGGYSGILRVPAGGGKPIAVVTPASGLSCSHPQFLPGGRSFLYLRWNPGKSADYELVMRSLERDDEAIILRNAQDYRYLKSGYLIYAQSSSGQGSDLIAAAFDPVSRKVIGNPVTVVKNVKQSSARGDTYQFTISDTGTLAYLPAPSDGNAGTRLAVVGRDGKSSVLPVEARDYSDPRVSPDGRLIAVHLQGDQNDVWVTDLTRGTLTRLSFEAGEDETPVWSPDGLFVAWASSRSDVMRGIYRRAADGSGQEELLWKLDKHAHVRDWLPDGRGLVIEILDPVSNTDIWRLDLDGKPTANVYLQTPFNERNSRLSPDGRWLAYVSDESGRDEIYIQSFPQPGTKLPVSRGGGDQPVWSRDGRSIFFRGGGTIQEASFEASPRPTVGLTHSLFSDHFESPQAGGHTGYDIFPDGRFLMIQASEAQPGTSVARPEIVLVFNWFEELRREVPTGGR